MSNTLAQIQQGLINEAKSKGGLLVLDNSIIQSDCFANLLTYSNVESFVVQVDAVNPEKDIYIDGTILYVTGAATIYNGAMPDFELQLNGDNETTRKAQVTGTLSAIALTDLNTLGLISANPLMPSLSFPGISFSAASDPANSSGQMMLSLTTSLNDWDILDALGIKLTSIGIIFTRLDAYTSALSLTGNILIPDTSSGKQVNVTLNIPSSTVEIPVWSITLSAAVGKTLIDLGDISTLLAGTNVFSRLPPGLSGVGGFGLTGLQVSFSQSTSGFSVQQVSTSVGCSNWAVGPSDQPIFTITSTGINITVTNPFNSATRGISTYIYGNFQIDPANSATTVSISMSIPAGKSDWVLNAYADIDLSGVSVFNHLPGNFNAGNINLPADTSAASLVINYFTISFNPSSLQLSFIQFSILLKATWWIIDNEFGIANPQLEVYIPGASLTDPPPLNVAASGNILLPDSVVLDVAASYAKGGAWSFAAALAPGSQVNLIKLVQQLLGSDIVPDSSLGLNTLMITDFAMGIVSDPAKNTCTYTLSGTTVTNWQSTFGLLPAIDASATLNIAYDGKNTSGSVAVTLDIFGITFTVKYNFTPNNETFELDWQGFTFIYDKTTAIIKATGGDWTVGEILTALINEINPGGDFYLPDPWDLLNSINLKNLRLQIDLNKKTISFTYALDSPIDLFFIHIIGFSVSVDNSNEVNVTIDGTYLGGNVIPSWDAANDSPPPVPGSGSDLFKLKFLALGQHVSLTGLDTVNTVGGALEDYEQYLFPPSPGSTTIPVKKTPDSPAKGTLIFDATNSWMIAADFTVAQFYQIQFVFDDPDLYGLRIGIADGASFLKNLDFEILYKKISDTIGMYQLDLQLPDEFRHLEFGEVSITMPNIGVQVYTNGNFYLDFGYPASITDFSRSFAIQVFPFVGYGGFYFGVLSGATSTQVPATTYGQFNPVIVAGLGLSLGVGKTIDEGILSAGLSLTVVGIFQGVLGFYTSYADSSETAVYYKFQATVGIIGHIYGEVNFAIISAQFDLLAYVYATIVVESNRPIPISFTAGVSITLTITINLGLFKIHISLSFSATISASFSIGSDTWSSAPWNNPGKTLLPEKFAAIAAKSYTLLWQPVAYDSGLPQAPAMNLYFIPHLTVATGGSPYIPQYVCMLYIDVPSPGDTTDKSSMGSLARGVLAWAMNALLNSGVVQTIKYSELIQGQVTADDLNALICVFNQQTDNQSPFDYNNPAKPGNDVNGFLKAFFISGGATTINISPVLPESDITLNAAVFAPFPDLQLQVTYNGNVIASTDFATQSMIGTASYVQELTIILNMLNVNYQANTANDPNTGCGVDNSGTGSGANLSLPTFLFTDLISLVAKQMLQHALDYVNAQTGKTALIGDVLDNSCTVANTIALAGMASRFLLHGLRLPTPPDAKSGAIQPLYVLTGQQFALPSTLKTTDTLQISLEKAAATTWISFNGSPAAISLPVIISATEITRITQTAAVTLSPVIEAGYPKAALNYSDGQQAFTLGAPALWQYPGSYDGLSNSPYLLKLPSNLQNELVNYQGNIAPDFTIMSLDKSASDPKPVPLTHFTWSTSVDVTVQKITGTDLLQSPLQGNIYNLIGADDTGVYFLESLVSYLNIPANNKFSGQVQLLYQPDPANNSKGGFISAANNTVTSPDNVSMAIVQANLSTETNPEKLLSFSKKGLGDDAAVSNTLNPFKEFVTLLWECSITRSGGYYFYYNNIASGNAGLPDELFTGNGSANLRVLITYSELVTEAFINSIVIGDVVNYQSSSVYAQSQSFMLRTALLAQGTIGYQMQRQTPLPYVPPIDPTVAPTPAQDELYLESQFNLVGLSIQGNSSYQNLLPSGPVDGDNTGKVVKTAADNIWNYSGNLSYNQFVQGAVVNAGLTDPYAGIGTTATLQLNWQDIFGNVLPLTPAAQNVNVPILYTDTLVAVSQWPSTSVFYEFAGDGTENVSFNLSFVFNEGKYNTGDKSAQNNAAVDLITWARLWFQLNHSTDMQLSYTVSINATAALPAGVVQPIDMGQLQANFITPIVNYLYAVSIAAIPANVPPPPGTKIVTLPSGQVLSTLTYTLSMVIDPASITSYTCIFPLTTVISMQRTQNIDPNFTNQPGVALAETLVQPYTQPANSASGLSLLYFTQQFETAFNNPASIIIYKVSTATNLTASSSDSTATPPIWIVRFDTAGKAGINLTYQVDKNNTPIAYYFAPVPLATALQNFSAEIIPYISGTAYDPTATGRQTNYASIDLDNWGLQFLNAVDKFLSPRYSVPAFLMDNGISLASILAAKQLIAEAITGTTDYIITPPSDPGTLVSVSNAQEKWYQQLLNKLAAAYNYTAAVQTPVSIASCFTGNNTDPVAAGASPRIYGKIIGKQDDGGNPANAAQNATFSAAKLPIAEGQSWLTYMFQVENGQSQAISFEELDFAISHIEWQYGSAGIDGYIPSSWLLIISPQNLPVSYINTGSIEIPVPLKAFPSTPSVTGQSANYPSSTPPVSNNPVTLARSWDYTFTYQAPSAAQDTTIIQVQFNNAASVKPNGNTNAGETPLDQALAQFMSMYNQLENDFDAYLVNVKSPTDPNVTNAAIAVNAFISILGTIATAWNNWNQVNPFRPSLTKKQFKPANSAPVPAAVTLNFTVEETSVDELPGNPLIINVTPFTSNTLALPIPVINIEGYTSASTQTGNTTSYTYSNAGGPLTYADRNKTPIRETSMPTLDVFEKQNAWAGLQLRRNLDLLLVPGSTTVWQLTNPSFVYQTPLVMFYSQYKPLFAASDIIDIAAIPSPDGTTPFQRTLPDQMIAFMNALTINITDLDSLTIKLECEYVYEAGQSGFQINIPVLLLPPYPLTIADNGAACAQMLAGDLAYWFSQHNPNINMGAWLFNLQVFSSFGNNLPMLSRTFNLNLASIK